MADFDSPIPIKIGNVTSTPSPDGKTALDVNIANNTGNLFTRPYDKMIVLSKNEYGDPLTIKSQLNGIDVQLVTVTYDNDGDFLSLEISNY